MIGAYHDSIAPGTAANRLTQARTYLTYAVHYGFNPLSPSTTDLCMYLQFLQNSFPAPRTIKNYLSGARTWLSEHGGNIAPFITFEYHQLVSGVTKRSQHVPSRAAPLTWDHIYKIVSFLDYTPGTPLAAKPCLLIGYHTLLRAGNLLSPTISAWGGPHTLAVQDIRITDDGLEITVYSTKTKSDPAPLTATIPRQQDPLTCPVVAWMRYVHIIRPWSLGPAFVTDNHQPLTPRQMIGLIRIALTGSTDINPAKVSMHSLRRGAAQSADQSGLSRLQIKEKGMWKTDSGLAPYLI